MQGVAGRTQRVSRRDVRLPCACLRKLCVEVAQPLGDAVGERSAAPFAGVARSTSDPREAGFPKQRQQSRRRAMVQVRVLRERHDVSRDEGCRGIAIDVNRSRRIGRRRHGAGQLGRFRHQPRRPDLAERWRPVGAADAHAARLVLGRRKLLGRSDHDPVPEQQRIAEAGDQFEHQPVALLDAEARGGAEFEDEHPVAGATADPADAGAAQRRGDRFCPAGVAADREFLVLERHQRRRTEQVDRQHDVVAAATSADAETEAPVVEQAGVDDPAAAQFSLELGRGPLDQHPIGDHRRAFGSQRTRRVPLGTLVGWLRLRPREQRRTF